MKGIFLWNNQDAIADRLRNNIPRTERFVFTRQAVIFLLYLHTNKWLHVVKLLMVGSCWSSKFFESMRLKSYLIKAPFWIW